MFTALLTGSIANKLKSWSLLFGSALFLTAALFILMNIFNPLQIGPNGILGFFFLLYLLSSVVALIGLKALKLLFKIKISVVKLLYLSATIAFAPVMLMALNTLNQLQIMDIILVVTFEFLTLFYIFRRIE